MSNCNCGKHGFGPQNRPLEDWEYPDENEPTYDRDDDQDIYDDPNYVNAHYNDEYEGEYGGVAFAGAGYETPQDEPSDKKLGSCSCGGNCQCGRHRHRDMDDEEEEDDELIVRCPNCGTELYDDDTECPRCGQYITNETEKEAPLWIIVAGSILIICILFAMTAYR